MPLGFSPTRWMRELRGRGLAARLSRIDLQWRRLEAQPPGKTRDEALATLWKLESLGVERARLRYRLARTASVPSTGPLGSISGTNGR